MSAYVPAVLRRLVARRAKWICEYCLIHEKDTFLGCQVEHIISQKHGGPTVESNLAYACVFCNRYKGSDLGSSLGRTGALCRFFNPRIDRWADHFRLDGNTIVPLTDVGEVTTEILGFNFVDRLIEREALRAAGRFPSAAALKHIS